MIAKETLDHILARFDKVQSLMATAEIATDPAQMETLGREHTSLSKIVGVIRDYQRALSERKDLREMVASETDAELAALAEAELEELEARVPEIEEDLALLLIPKNPEDSKNAIVEIRAGTGGDEASLFAGDLFRLYSRVAERQGWRIEEIESSEGTVGGFKEIIFSVSGADAFGTMKYESGVHRVQRVPATESSGRIHTSAATVAVLPEAEAVDVAVDPNELKIDVYRSSGPGGQSVNTTDSAVRILHKPTGVMVTMQDEKSQIQNRARAMVVLRSRLLQAEQERLQAASSAQRRDQVGGGGRSEKIRTYNFKENRVTDHRIGLTLYKLDKVLAGELVEVSDALVQDERTRQLQEEVESNGVHE